jgi:elongation factor 1-beta
MGSVALIIKVMPESPEVDLEKLKEEIRKRVKGLNDMKEEPIGFGLKALKIAVVVNDTGGESDAVEQEVNDIEGVERAEIVELTLT